MTVIACYASPDLAVMGADMLLTDDENHTTLTKGKVWYRDGVLYGGAGSYAQVQAIRFCKLPKAPTKDFEAWGVHKLIPAIKKALKGTEGVPALLVAIPGMGVAMVDSQYAFVHLPANNVMTTGNGGQYAKGYLFGKDADPYAIMGAVRAAVSNDAACGGVPNVLVLVKGDVGAQSL